MFLFPNRSSFAVEERFATDYVYYLNYPVLSEKVKISCAVSYVWGNAFSALGEAIELVCEILKDKSQNGYVVFVNFESTLIT